MLLAFFETLGGPRVSLADLPDIADVQIIGDSLAALTIDSDGNIRTETTTLGPLLIGPWIVPTSAAGANYEVRVTLNSGSLNSGTVGTWEALNSPRSWSTFVASGGGEQTANITVEIRLLSGTVLASRTINISAASGP